MFAALKRLNKLAELVYYEGEDHSDPPPGFGDFDPEYLPGNNKLTWTRSNWEKHDVWVSDPNGSNAAKWV